MIDLSFRGEKGMKRLVVTADDFGAAVAVNEAVEEGPPTQSVYLVLVLAALAVLLLSQAVRYLAVRLTMSGG